MCSASTATVGGRLLVAITTTAPSTRSSPASASSGAVNARTSDSTAADTSAATRRPASSRRRTRPTPRTAPVTFSPVPSRRSPRRGGPSRATAPAEHASHSPRQTQAMVRATGSRCAAATITGLSTIATTASDDEVMVSACSGASEGRRSGAASASASTTESSRSATSCSCAVRTAAWNTPANWSLSSTASASPTATGRALVASRVSAANRSTSRLASRSLTSSSASAAVARSAKPLELARLESAHDASRPTPALTEANTTRSQPATVRRRGCAPSVTRSAWWRSAPKAPDSVMSGTPHAAVCQVEAPRTGRRATRESDDGRQCGRRHDLRRRPRRAPARAAAGLLVPATVDPGQPGHRRGGPDGVPDVHRHRPDLLPVLRQGARRLLPRPRVRLDHAQLGAHRRVRDLARAVLLPAGGRRRLRAHRRAVPDAAARLPQHVRVLLHRAVGGRAAVATAVGVHPGVGADRRRDLGVRQAAAGVVDPRRPAGLHRCGARPRLVRCRGRHRHPDRRRRALVRDPATAATARPRAAGALRGPPRRPGSAGGPPGRPPRQGHRVRPPAAGEGRPHNPGHGDLRQHPAGRGGEHRADRPGRRRAGHGGLGRGPGRRQGRPWLRRGLVVLPGPGGGEPALRPAGALRPARRAPDRPAGDHVLPPAADPGRVAVRPLLAGQRAAATRLGGAHRCVTASHIPRKRARAPRITQTGRGASLWVKRRFRCVDFPVEAPMTVSLSGPSHPGLSVGTASEFSLFFQVKPGHGGPLRQALSELQDTPGYRPGDYGMAIQSIHEARFVLFDEDSRLAFITSFDGPWDAYMEDFFTSGPTLALFDAIFRHMDGYDGLPDMAALQEFILGAQVSAAAYARNYGGTVKEIRKAERVNAAFQQVLDHPDAAEALQHPALKPLLEEAAD